MKRCLTLLVLAATFPAVFESYRKFNPLPFRPCQQRLVWWANCLCLYKSDHGHYPRDLEQAKYLNGADGLEYELSDDGQHWTLTCQGRHPFRPSPAHCPQYSTRHGLIYDRRD